MKGLIHPPLYGLTLIAQILISTWAYAENLQVQPAPSSPVDSLPLRLEDIQGPVTIADPVNWLVYLVIGLGSIFLATLIWWWLKKHNKTATPPSAMGVALQKIEKISNLKEQDSLFYVTEISHITREYIEERFAIPASKTTGQFFQGLPEAQQLPENCDLDFFSKIFTLFDMTKFAHRPPSTEEAREIEQTIVDFIRQGGDNALS